MSNKKFISGVVDFVFGSHYFQKYAYGKKFPPELESIRSRQIRKRVTLLMVAVLIALYFFNRNYRDFLPDNFGYTELIIGLFPINLNLILLILIGFLLLRNLIKIIYERKQRLFGYKLKVKIMAGFFISGIIPVAIYFSATQGFFSNSFHTWFKDKLNSAISGSDDILEAYKGLMQDDLAHYALLTVQNAPEKLTDIKNKQADTFLSQKIYEYRLSGAAFYDSSFNLLTSRFENDALREAWKPVKPEQIKFEGLLKPGFIFELTPQGAVSRSIVAFENNGQTYYLELIRAEADTGRRLYPTVKNTLTLFLGLSSLEPLVTKTYNYYVLTLTMMIIGLAMWFGLYISRTITTPLDQLVDATDKISDSEFNPDLPSVSNDEVGKLTKAFKTMAERLQQKQTELQASENSLLEANENLRVRNNFIETLLDNIQYGILAFDMQGYVRIANSQISEMFDIKKTTHRVHYSNILPFKYSQSVWDMYTHMTTAKEDRASTDIYGDVQGQMRHFSIRLFILKDEDVTPIGILAVFHDLTEIDRSTRAKAWQEVARRIAHEIKNPLTPIQLSAQRIRSRFIEKQESDLTMLEKSLDTIIKEVGLLKGIVNEFENFARIPEIQLKKINIETLTDSVIELFRPGLENRIILTKKISDSIPEILADAEHINRVMINLITNAVSAIESITDKYPGEMGNIEIRLSCKDNNLLLDIADNGSGVTLPDPQQIFEPYVTTRKNGTGLGLAIVRRIIADHDGFIRFEHNTPRGSIFKIQLPIKE